MPDSEENGASPSNEVVLYDTRFGNTKKIADSLCLGLDRTGARSTGCFNVKDTNVDLLSQYTLTCFVSPTEAFGPTKDVKALLANFKEIDLSVRFGFAFDKRIDLRVSGSAAKSTEKRIKRSNILILNERKSAIVSTQRWGGQII